MKQSSWIAASLLAVFSSALLTRADQVVISEIMYNPPGNLPEYIEVYNNTVTPFDIAKWRLRGDVDYDFPPFSPGSPQDAFLKPYERIVLSSADPATTRSAYGIPQSIRVFGPWNGNLDNNGDTVRLRDKNGVEVTTVTWNDRGHWPRAADGAGHSLVLKNPNGEIDNWRNWTFSDRPLGTPGTQPAAEAETPVGNPEINLNAGIPVVDYDSVWKYNADNVNLGTAWRANAYNDSTWSQGPGLLGFEDSALPAPGIQTDLKSFDVDQLTYYFRTRFVYNGPTAGVNITIDTINDDGSVLYLNGVEIGRVGMPGGTVSFNTQAGRTVGNAAEELNVITTSGANLVQGTNVLAVEAHQTNPTSSDIVWGCRFKISVPIMPGLVINEVFPGPSGSGFIEFYNPTLSAINLRDHYLSNDGGDLDKWRITSDIIVPAGGLASVGYVESGFPLTDPTTVYLTEPDGATAVTAISASIPLDGRSLGRKPTGSGNWFLFVDPTRNLPNASVSSLSALIRLNEVHFSLTNTVDWVEFHNASEAALSMDGLFLTSESDFSDKIPLSGSIASGGFASFDTSFNAGGNDLTLYLVNSSDAVIYARRFNKTGLGQVLQAFPDGEDEWYGAVSSSRNLPNNPPRQTDIVINEIMYDPPSDELSGEYIELFNRGAQSVDMSGWEFSDGINYTFPQGTIIPAGGYLVVVADEDWMRSAYGPIPVLGNFGGQLGNNGELVRLEDQWGGLVDQVDYLPGGDWPTLANGAGSSMELRHPLMDNELPSAWSSSNETNKSQFTHYTYTDTYRRLRSDGGVTDHKELHFHLVGDSHVAIQNVTMQANGSGANIIQNGTSMSSDGGSSSGWLVQGTHWASHILGNVLHIISDGHGDNRPNRVEIDANTADNTSYTVQFDARWVAGAPRLVMQTWDHSIATSIGLPIPDNLGTPGVINSKFIPSPAPQVDELIHSPAVPSSGQAVTVRARITAAGSAPVVRLWHREDNNSGNAVWQSTPMVDNGFSGGDEVAGDGIYSTQLTQYSANGQIAQFYVVATADSQSSQMPKWGADRPAMFVIDTPSSLGDLRKMRFVVSEYDLRTISDSDSPTSGRGYKFPRLSNHYWNSTCIVNEREIFYNCEIRNSGSPWTRGNNLSRGKYKFPKDKLWRDKIKYTFDNDAGDNGSRRYHNRICRQWLYYLGHPANEHEYLQIEINNDGNSLREEVEPLGNDLLDRNFPDGSEGELYRIDDEWWFTDGWGRSSRNADWSYKGTDNPGRYRTEWMKRSREDEDDYSALIGMFRKINSTYSQEEIERLIDPYQTLKMAAVRGYIHDWDTFSLDRGKNAYLYRRSTDGRFMFFHWDSDLAFRSGDIGNSTFISGMAGFRTWKDRTYNRRIFRHYLARLIEEFCNNSPRMGAWLDAEEASSSQFTVSSYFENTWFPQRETVARNYLGNDRNVTFAITSNGGNPITTTSSILNLSGAAPLRTFEVVVDGHPEAVFTWANNTSWTLTGIQLQSGANVLQVRSVDEEGNIQHTDTILVTTTANGVPVMDLDADPGSFRVSVLEFLQLDARDSYDPEGTELTFSWQAAPADVQLDTSDNNEPIAFFPRPGLYSITATGTDEDGQFASITREAAVYAPDGFSPFNDPILEPWWTVENAELRPNNESTTYYSLNELEGRLVLQTQEDTARPMGTGTPIYPFISRPLPSLTDWVFMTKVGTPNNVFGDYNTGLMVKMLESGSAVKYAMSIQDGQFLRAQKITSGGSISTLSSQAMVGTEATVRIRRVGNTLFFDILQNEVWSVFHSAGVPVGASAVRAGMFLATDTAARMKASFDFAILIDPSATSDLRENLRFSEIMFDPVGGSDYEFVELFNIGNIPLDLTGVYFSDGIDYVFGPTTLGPKQRIVVVKNQAAFASRYNLANINVAPGEYGGRLANIDNGGGETLELSDAEGEVILSVFYRADGLWPTQTDGTGRSLEIVDPNGNLNDGSNWRASPELNGSPGAAGGNGLGTILINEVLTHTDFPLEDAIELYNRTDSPIDISGWFLSDSDAEFKKYQIPNGTVIGANDYVVFYEIDFQTNNTLVPFSLSSANGDQVHLSAADSSGNLTGFQVSVDFGPAENGVSFGRYRTSVGTDFPPMSARTFGADNPANHAEFRSGTGLPNADPLISPIVISEVMYHPPDIGGTNDNVMDEYVELYNNSSQNIPLFDPDFTTNTWRLRGGADFDLPMGILMTAHSYLLLVSFDPSTNAATTAAFRSTYGIPTTVAIRGPYQGKLANNSESVRLQRPDTPQGPGPSEGLVPYIEVDMMRYNDLDPWPASADGLGDSLQRRRPGDYANDPVNWKGEAPTPGRANVPGSGFVDTDNDGLPDDYEVAQSLNANDPSDALQDTDTDGELNIDEFWAGTNPNDIGDFLSPPSVVSPPQDRVVNAGQAASFSVAATGTLPLAYQWWFNGVPIPSATNATLIVANVQGADQGEYHVVVDNAAGFDISDSATLSVIQPLAIIAQPLSQLADVGGSATFSVFAVGTGTLQYQWRFNGADIPGADSAVLTLNNVQTADSGNYSVVVTDDNSSVGSAQATLDVLSPPLILSQPSSKTVVAYSDTFFSVQAGGQGPFTYQWRLNGVALQGETNAVISLPNVQPNQAGVYNVEVFNPVSSVVSDNAILDILIPADITQQPFDQVVDPGANVTFSVVAFSSTPITYQWQFNDIDIPGATGPTLLLFNVQEEDAGNYRCVVTDGVGSVNSDIALLVVLTEPVVLIAPLSQGVVEGGTLSLSILTRGALPMGYRWRQGFFTKTNYILTSHQSFYTVDNVTSTDGGAYTVVLTNAAFYQPGILSPAATVTILADGDGDGMADAWENDNDLNPLDPNDDILDGDGDGMTNKEEHDAGTNPGDAGSYLHLVTVTDGPGAGKTIEFSAASNKTYSLEFTDNLLIGNWQKVADIVAHPTNRVAELFDPQRRPQRYYRVRTPADPEPAD